MSNLTQTLAAKDAAMLSAYRILRNLPAWEAADARIALIQAMGPAAYHQALNRRVGDAPYPRALETLRCGFSRSVPLEPSPYDSP